jgi:hypothetical protein
MNDAKNIKTNTAYRQCAPYGTITTTAHILSPFAPKTANIRLAKSCMAANVETVRARDGARTVSTGTINNQIKRI